MKHYLTLTLLFTFGGFLTLSAQAGKLISRSYLFYNNGTLSSGDSATIAYNAELLPSLYRNYKLAANGTWELKSRLLNEQYDANGNILVFLIQKGNDQIGWTDDQRYTYTYNAGNLELTNTIEQWNGTTWEPYSFSEKVYDANDRLITSSNAWTRQDYSYNAEGLLATITTQSNIGNNWVNSGQEEYAYFPNSSRIETITSKTWNMGSWLTSLRRKYTYDANGNTLLDVTEYWNQVDWEASSRLEMTYDASNNLISWVSSNWDGTAWMETLRQFNTFDQQNNFTSARTEFMQSGVWELGSIGRLHYGTVSGLESLNLAELQVFPNPANATVTIQGEQLQAARIVDRQGKLVSQLHLGQSGTSTASVAHLAPGVYFLQVENAQGRTGVKPLVIQR